MSYATVDGTGIAGVDYTKVSGVLSWANGDATDRTIVVPILSGTDRSFSVNLGIPIGGVSLGQNAVASVTIARISPTTKSVGHLANSYPITVATGAPWTASENLNWVSLDTSSGTGASVGTINVSVDANLTHDERVGTIVVAEVDHTLTQAGAPYASATPVTKSVSHTAQNYDIDVDAAIGWTATESLPWITINPANGFGDGTITVSVLANPTHDPRVGVISIDGQSHTVTQLGAPKATFPLSQSVNHTAQSYNIPVTAVLGWNAAESLDWVTITPTSGTGNGTINVTVAENLSTTSQRIGTISIDGTDHTLTQSAAPLIIELSPESKDTGEAAQNYDVTVTANGPWTASDDQSWVTLSPATGNGNGIVTVTLTENPSASPRSGTVTISGQAHSVTQSGAPFTCNFTPSTKSTGNPSSSYSIMVSSNGNWTVSESIPWASVSPSSGSNNGMVTANVQESSTIYQRQGTITICGETHTLTQNGATLNSIQPGVSGYHQKFSFRLPELDEGWAFQSDGEGNIESDYVEDLEQIMRMDDSIDGGAFSLNEAIVQVDLTGMAKVVLTFRHRHANDEPDLMPETFSGSTPADGVAISTDGVQWHRIVDFSDRSATWKTYEVDLVQAAADAGLELTDSFQIKFQQYGSMSWPNDGFEFDDVTVGEPEPGSPKVTVGAKSRGPFRSRITIKNKMPRKGVAYAKIADALGTSDSTVN